jgi:N-formylglutamate amidohydrolase
MEETAVSTYLEMTDLNTKPTHANLTRRTALVLTLAMLMGACGGGSAGGTTPVPTPTPTPTPTPLDPNDFIRIEIGTLPVVISAPHGGQTVIPGIAERSSGTTVLDTNTFQVASAIQARLLVLTGKRAHLVAAIASRKYVDFNRSAELAYEDVRVKPVYDRYYSALRSAVDASRVQAPAAAVLIDLHGQGEAATITYRGTRNGLTASNVVFYTMPDGLITSMNASALGVNPGVVAGVEHSSFTGGNLVQAFGHTSANGINSIQLEFGYSFRSSASVATETGNKMAVAIVAHLRATGAL